MYVNIHNSAQKSLIYISSWNIHWEAAGLGNYSCGLDPKLPAIHIQYAYTQYEWHKVWGLAPKTKDKHYVRMYIQYQNHQIQKSR
jgi:hypothetical protein